MGQLEPHRLLALEPVRLLERREIEPADLRRDLRDDLAGRRDRALDGEDLGARDRGLRDRGGGRAAWHDHRARQPAARGVHGGGAAGVARRGDHEAGRAACSGKRNCHAEAASLERAGGVLALVLAPDVAEPEMCGEPAQGQQRRTPLAQRHRRLVFVERCELAEAVHARRACAQRLLRHVLVHLLEVVAHGEHLAALLADAEHALGVVAVPADRALDVADEAHRMGSIAYRFRDIDRRRGAESNTTRRRAWRWTCRRGASPWTNTIAWAKLASSGTTSGWSSSPGRSSCASRSAPAMRARSTASTACGRHASESGRSCASRTRCSFPRPTRSCSPTSSCCVRATTSTRQAIRASPTPCFASRPPTPRCVWTGGGKTPPPPPPAGARRGCAPRSPTRAGGVASRPPAPTPA